MGEINTSRKDLRSKNQKTKRTRSIIRAIIIIGLTAVFARITGIFGTSLAYLGDFLSQGLSYIHIGKGWPKSGDYTDMLQAEKMGSALCVLDKDNLTLYSPTGGEIQIYSHSMQNPIISASGSRAVLYDLNSTSLKVLNASTVVFSRELSNSIVHADICKSNKVAVTTKSSGYSGEVTVYSYSMEPKMTWYCASGYPIYSKLSDNGNYLASLAVSTEGVFLKNSIYIIDVKNGKEMHKIDCDDYPLDILFTSSSEFLVIYPDKLTRYSVESGGEISSYGFDGGYLKTYTEKNGYIALSYGSTVFFDSSKLVLLTDGLEEKFSADVDDNVSSLSLSQSRLFALGSENLYEFNYDGLLTNTENVSAFSKMLVNYNGTKLITSVEIENIKKAKNK